MPEIEKDSLRRRIGMWLLGLMEKHASNRSKYFLRLSVLCQFACEVTIWLKIEGLKAIDTNSSIYKEIKESAEYYLYLDNFYRKTIGYHETLIVPGNFLKWYEREDYLKRSNSHWRFVRRHGIVSILKKFRNIQRLINLRASEEIKILDDEAEKFWRSKIVTALLPLGIGANGREIRRYGRRAVAVARRKIGENIRYRYSFSLGIILH